MEELFLTQYQHNNIKSLCLSVFNHQISLDNLIHLITRHMRRLQGKWNMLLIGFNTKPTYELRQNIIIVLARIWLLKNLINTINGKLIDPSFGFICDSKETSVEKYVNGFIGVLENYYQLYSLMNEYEKKRYERHTEFYTKFIENISKILMCESHMTNDQSDTNYQYDLSDICH